jgi:GPI mannosyltransferase 1 subunit M
VLTTANSPLSLRRLTSLLAQPRLTAREPCEFSCQAITSSSSCFYLYRRLSVALLLAALLRCVLILWSFHQDSTSGIKYTDVDYTVFTDAARCLVRPSSSPDCTVATGPLASLPLFSKLGDPYARDTYRYTPLLASLTAPNILLHPAFGKVLFSLADLIVGVLLHSLVRRRGVSNSKATLYVASIWLLNPIIANISTRGSAESVLGVLVVSVLALAERGRWNAAAVAFGLAVHFKIFPIIYGSSLLAAIGASKGGWITSAHIKFGLISFASFMTLNGVMYAL